MAPEHVVVLSVDFDFWYPGWSTGEDAHCGRCAGCRGKAPGRPNERDACRDIDITVEHVLNLIDYFTPCYAAECHADIVPWMENMQRHSRGPESWYVYDLDHHCDTGVIEGDWLDCGNWVSVARQERLIDHWDELIFSGIPRAPDYVFTCKSSPYLMPDGDRPWNAWLAALERKGCELTFTGHMAQALHADFLQKNGETARQ